MTSSPASPAWIRCTGRDDGGSLCSRSIHLSAVADWTAHRGAFAALEQLRLRISRRLGQVPLGFLTNRRSGEVQCILSDDIERLELFLGHFVPDMVSAMATLLFTVAWLFIMDWRMALVRFAAAPATGGVLRVESQGFPGCYSGRA